MVIVSSNIYIHFKHPSCKPMAYIKQTTEYSLLCNWKY